MTKTPTAAGLAPATVVGTTNSSPSRLPQPQPKSKLSPGQARGLGGNATYQLMPDMSPAEFEALKADIAQRGVVVPIDVDEHGNILDGHNRYRAWAELKKNEPPPMIVREGLSEQEKRAFARKNNILRRHLTREQVRQLIAEQLKDSPEWADNRIAEELGVDGKTVGSIRNDMESTSEIPKLDRLVGKDGKTRPRKQPRKTRAPVEDFEDEIDEFEDLQEAEPDGRAFARALKAYAQQLGEEVGDANDLPDDIKLQMFAAGLSGADTVVFKGPGPTEEGWARMSEEPGQVAIHERCADFMAGPGGMAELAKICPENAEAIAHHHDWMARNGWTVEAWFGAEGEEIRRAWAGSKYKPPSKKKQKERREMLRRMIDAGVFGPPVLDGRCHEW
jgi:ParB-like chromosome segregation protein Spo0J